MVLAGFIAAWFFAASPINRSCSVKETKDGVVKLPCSLATAVTQLVIRDQRQIRFQHTDLDTCALINCNAAVSGTYAVVSCVFFAIGGTAAEYLQAAISKGRADCRKQ